MRCVLVYSAIVAVCSVLPAGCDGEAEQKRDEHARETAADWGAYRAELVALTAGEKAQLDPRSERSQKSREARERLDEIVPRETDSEETR